MVKFQQTCKRLMEASIPLNQASDEFNKHIKLIEDSLSKLNTGVICNVIIDKATSLHHAKGPTGWGLYIIQESNQDEKTQLWRFTDAPRYLRIKAVEAIPALLKEMEREIQYLTNQLTESTNKIKDWTPK